MPGSGITVPGLDQDVRLENAFDILLANAPARLFFMSLVKDTNINMVVHPSVEVEISLDLEERHSARGDGFDARSLRLRIQAE
jgi:hypothetical protein